MQIRFLNPYDEAARALLAQSDALMASRYPPASQPLGDPRVLAGPEVLFLGVWLSEWLAGCAGVRPQQDADGDYGEIQRVFVRREFRRRGLSTLLIGRLEDHMRRRGVHLARLAAGVHQPEALALYESLGYVRRGPFGDHGHHPLSVFMEKRLDG